MNLLKIITILNWIIIGLLGLLVAAETLFPAKGGDAAGRGMGQALYYLSIIALVVLLVLNFLPYAWSKYTALGLVVLPILLVQVFPIWQKAKQGVQQNIKDSGPIFEDKTLDQIARTVHEVQPEKLKKLLETPVPGLFDDGELLGYAIAEANSTTYKPEERLECVRLLFQAGASLDPLKKAEEVPIHMAVADVGNAPLLRLLLEHSADANAYQIHFERPILFEALNSYYQPEETVRVLLDYGADPNSRALFDDENGPVSPLWRAAQLERWGMCVMLLEKGANPDFKALNDQTVRDLVVASERVFPVEGYSRQADYVRLREMLR
jgi:hypothetical protein